MDDVIIEVATFTVAGEEPIHIVTMCVNNAKHGLHDENISFTAKSERHAHDLTLRLRAALCDCTDLRVVIE